MHGESILNQALKIINGDREKEYGSPRDNFDDIALLWDIYLGGRGKLACFTNITREDVANMMIGLKYCRLCRGSKEDTLVDIAGYAGIGGDFIWDETEPKAGREVK